MSVEKAIKGETAPDPIRSKVTTAGRVTIPEPIRWAFGINDGDKVEFKVEDGQIILEKTDE